MKGETIRSKIVPIAIVAIVVAAVLFLVWESERKVPEQSATLDAFAQCLSAKGAVMYGTYWCAHCKSQKAMFGGSFKYVSYVECTEEIEKCLTAKIEGYPTWTFADSTRLEGEQPLERLAAASGCELPKNN